MLGRSYSLLNVAIVTGNQLPWGAPLVYGSLIAGGVLLIAFILVEKYVAREPVSAAYLRSFELLSKGCSKLMLRQFQLLPLRVLVNRTPLFVFLTNWFM